MSRIDAQTQRLYFLPAESDDTGPRLISTDDRVRALVLGLGGPADWAALAPLWKGVQADFKWPEPAIVVDGRGAFELWFSMAEPLPRREAVHLLGELRRRFLAGVRDERLHAWPSADAAAELPACPPFAVGPERWAAFVTPDLPSVFGDDPALDFEPAADAQAELLARLRSVSAAALRKAQTALVQKAAPPPAPPPPAPPLQAHTAEPAQSGFKAAAINSVTGHFKDPRTFMLAVMNDPAVPLALRIDAAKGLLRP